MAEGKFIVVEGIDGAGITTQASRLVTALQADGLNALLTREPSDGPVGSVIGQALRHRVNLDSEDVMALLFAADRLDHLEQTVVPSLDDSIHVVSQRYYLSSLAYQSESLGLDWIWSLNERARTPDLVIYLSVPFRLADKRIPARWERQRYEATENLRSVSARFNDAIHFLRDKGVAVTQIDGTGTIDEVRKDVYHAAQETLGTGTPQGTLFEAI